MPPFCFIPVQQLTFFAYTSDDYIIDRRLYHLVNDACHFSSNVLQISVLTWTQGPLENSLNLQTLDCFVKSFILSSQYWIGILQCHDCLLFTFILGEHTNKLWDILHFFISFDVTILQQDVIKNFFKSSLTFFYRISVWNHASY